VKATLRYTIALLGAYFVAWSASYAIVTFNAVHRLDFSLYFEWLVLAWTFHGGEMVGAAWLLSIVAFLPLAGVAVFLVKRIRAGQGTGSLQSVVFKLSHHPSVLHLWYTDLREKYHLQLPNVE